MPPGSLSFTAVRAVVTFDCDLTTVCECPSPFTCVFRKAQRRRTLPSPTRVSYMPAGFQTFLQLSGMSPPRSLTHMSPLTPVLDPESSVDGEGGSQGGEVVTASCVPGRQRAGGLGHRSHRLTHSRVRCPAWLRGPWPWKHPAERTPVDLEGGPGWWLPRAGHTRPTKLVRAEPESSPCAVQTPVPTPARPLRRAP